MARAFVPYCSSPYLKYSKLQFIVVMWRLYARKAIKIARGSDIGVLMFHVLEVLTKTALMNCWSIILVLKAFVNVARIAVNSEAIVAHFAMPQGCASSAYNFFIPLPTHNAQLC